LLKINSSGNIQWSKQYSADTYNDAHYVQQSSDGGYIIAGNESSISGNQNIYIIKTDVNGNTLWSKTFGGTDSDNSTCVQRTSDGGYIVIGTTYSFGNGQNDIYLLKISSVGSLIWSKTYGTTDEEVGSFVRQTADGGYIMTGYALGSSLPFYLAKTNSSGNLQWARGYGFTSDWGSGSQVYQTNDGGYIAVGDLSQVNDSGNVYVLKTDNNGSTGCNEVNLNFSTTSPSTISTIANTTVTSGITQNNVQTLISSGAIIGIYCSNVFVNEIGNQGLQILISPNPFSTSATVELVSGGRYQEVIFEMYDVFGREVKQLVIRNSSSFVISRDNLPSGIYFYKLSNSTEIIGTGKIIIE
jgi:hypothetical protein